MPDPVEAVSFPVPPTPCDEGTVYSPIITCNGMGEWIPAWVLADSGSFTAQERVKAAGTLKVPCKCASDPAALVRLGAELFKAGIEFAGRK